MDPTLLTQRGWKAAKAKFRFKDNGLERELIAYEKANKDKPEVRLDKIASVKDLVDTLRKDKDVVATSPAAVKYLSEMSNAAQEQQRDLEKAKVVAAAEAAAQKKADEKEEQEGDYATRLMTALQKLKSTRDLSYPFIICEGKPFWGLMVAKQITPQHRAELGRVVLGAGKRFFPGWCKFEEGKFAFSLENPMSGLARKLQDSIKHYTGKKLPLIVGKEVADEEDR